MAYKVIILYRLYMPPYFLGTFTEYPKNKTSSGPASSEYLRTRNNQRFLRKKSFIRAAQSSASTPFTTSVLGWSA